MHSDYKNRIELLFCVLASAYETYNYDKIRSCYLSPCQLNWAGTTSILTETSSFNSQFDSVWSSLRTADFQRFKCDRGSIQILSENQALACIQWTLLNSTGGVIRSVSSTYLLIFGSSGWKISCDIVHDASKYILLPEKLSIKL